MKVVGGSGFRLGDGGQLVDALFGVWSTCEDRGYNLNLNLNLYISYMPRNLRGVHGHVRALVKLPSPAIRLIPLAPPRLVIISYCRWFH